MNVSVSGPLTIVPVSYVTAAFTMPTRCVVVCAIPVCGSNCD